MFTDLPDSWRPTSSVNNKSAGDPRASGRDAARQPRGFQARSHSVRHLSRDRLLARSPSRGPPLPRSNRIPAAGPAAANHGGRGAPEGQAVRTVCSRQNPVALGWKRATAPMYKVTADAPGRRQRLPTKGLALASRELSPPPPACWAQRPYPSPPLAGGAPPPDTFVVP